jgi:GDP-L-fucose synthase
MKTASKIYVAGHTGMVGSAVVRALRARGFDNLLLRTSGELDLTQQRAVTAFFKTERPDYVFLAAARVGGILANKTYRAEFIHRNLEIQTHVFHAAWECGVQDLFFFSSSCVYPRQCPQPMKETDLWSGPLEPTNEPYAVAKLAGMSMCRAFNDQYGLRWKVGIPTNLYGPYDNYDPEQSHIMAALIHKFDLAKREGRSEVRLWGTGSPRREMMFVDDAADAALFLMDVADLPEPINIGVGADRAVRDIAAMVGEIVGYTGTIVWDPTMPDGAPQKLLDTARLRALGWVARTSLEDGLVRAYDWYRQFRAGAVAAN